MKRGSTKTIERQTSITRKIFFFGGGGQLMGSE